MGSSSRTRQRSRNAMSLDSPPFGRPAFWALALLAASAAGVIVLRFCERVKSGSL